jgi:hypothetical protein
LPDATANPNFKPIRHNSRPNIEAKREKPRPLCAGLIYGAMTVWKSKRDCYLYEIAPMDKNFGIGEYAWSREADSVDDAVTYHLLERLRLTFSKGHFEKALQKLDSSDDRTIKRQKLTLKSIEKQMENLLNGLKNLSEPEMIRKAQDNYKELKAAKAQIETEIEKTKTTTFQREELEHLREHFDELISGWDNLTQDEKHVFFQRMIEKIVLEDYQYRGNSRFKIYWKDGDTEEFIVRPQSARGVSWSYAELQQLYQLLAKNAPIGEIRKAFSYRHRSSVYTIVRTITENGEGFYAPRLDNSDPSPARSARCCAGLCRAAGH